VEVCDKYLFLLGMRILLKKFIKCDLIYGIPGLNHNDNEKFFNYADDFLKKRYQWRWWFYNFN